MRTVIRCRDGIGRVETGRTGAGAECHSAIRQIDNLRYDGAAAKAIWKGRVGLEGRGARRDSKERGYD